MTQQKQPELILTFNWDGTVVKETTGFSGKKCTEIMKFIEEALHGKNLKRTFKREYNEPEQAHESRLRY